MENSLPFSEMPPDDGLWETGGILSPFQPTLHENIISVLNKINLQPSDTIFDLGCGDGRVLFHAAFMGCKKAVGIELNSDLALSIQSKIDELGLNETVQVLCADFLLADFESANVIYLYLLPEALLKLKSKLESVFEHNTRIVISCHFPIPWWTGEKFENYFIYSNN